MSDESTYKNIARDTIEKDEVRNDNVTVPVKGQERKRNVTKFTVNRGYDVSQDGDGGVGLEDLLPDIPRKINLGKTKGYDIIIFAIFVIILFVYASMSDPGVVEVEDVEKPKRKAAKNRKIFVTVPLPQVNYSFNPLCGLVLAESSVPGKPFGVFALKNFTKGDTFSDFEVILPIDGMEEFVEKSPYLDNPSENNFFINFGDLLQKHPYLYNTAYTSSHFAAARDVIAGREIFNLQKETDEYDTADKIVKELMALLGKSPLVSRQKKTELLQRPIFNMLRNVVYMFDKKVAALLPSTIETLQKTSRRGSAYQSLQNKTHYFLQENGICIDKIKQGRSIVNDGGKEKGAFAARNISEGELVVPALLHAVNKSTFVKDQEGWSHPIINYCFAHEESSIVLCHMTSAALINHKISFNRSNKLNNECEATSSNAEYVWSSWNEFNEVGKSLSPSDLLKNDIDVLSFDIIATRDIMEGEEIFYDYGVGWSHAWDDKSADPFFHPILLKDDMLPLEWRDSA